MSRVVKKLTALFLISLFAASCNSGGDPDVGSVVTPAKTGYQNSVFENSEQKCQHCHYDLYNTWKDSMHAQSWSDPIFQTLYQRFLTMLMEKKIGVAGPTGTITVATAQKMGAVCMTCHAPAAFYSKDFTVTIEEAPNGASPSNPAGSFNPASPAVVVGGANVNDGKSYKATYHIGNATGREGINCAFCHSIEQVRMTHAGETYTLKDAIKTAPAIGNVIYPPGSTLRFSQNSSDADMNAFFQITGPEIHGSYANTSGSKKGRDGRYLMKSIPLDDQENGKTHYAGGPYYGPYGIYGLHNDNPNDQTDRAALVDPAFSAPDNHFEDRGKAICLACHQRSAKVLDPATGASRFMELCTTWTVTDDNLYKPGQSGSGTASPKCQSCHMEKRNGLAINEWYSPGTPPDLADTPQKLADNVRNNVFHSHQFEGATVPAKIKAGFSADMSANLNGSAVNVYTTILNKTAHMFPGAHPMRRALTMVRVKDANGAILPLSYSTISTNYEDVNYTYTGANSAGTVDVMLYRKPATPTYTFAGFWDVPNGAVGSQWFASGSKRISDDGATDRFVRIYGRQTISASSGAVLPGFSSNSTVDNRLLPNERESFDISFDASGATGPITVEYKVYYMKKGASAAFPIDPATGFLDGAANKANKLAIMEVYSKSVTLQ